MKYPVRRTRRQKSEISNVVIMSQDNTRIRSGNGLLRGQQRHSLMNGLQIFRQQVRVSPCHLQSRMTEHFLEMEHAAAFPQIINCESVPKCVERSFRRGNI
jgi:hypothetical protein